MQKIDLQRNEIYTFDKELREAWKGTLGGDHIEEDINGNLWIRENNGLLIYKRSENKFVYLPYKGGSTVVFRGMSHIEANLHVDGAYGGFATALPELRSEFTGLENADSLAVDPHKWLYTPLEAGCVLVKKTGTLNGHLFLPPALLQFLTSRTELH